jgi:arginine-tRNA-protein transferase
MNLLKEFSTQDKCSYLQDKTQFTHYKVIENCSSKECQELIERGYRRFGKMYFRPICASCQECQSIKIDAQNYKFSKSARRILKKAKDIKSYLQTPTMSQAHIDLFAKYHLYMKEKKSWTYHETTPEHYYQSFVDGHGDFGYEVLYFYEGELIGVDLIDILEDGISSIYFYYDPDFASYSLGKLSLYNQIKYAINSQKKWVYLGYYVEQCPSLSYKAEYKPYLTLEGRPNLREAFVWN